MRIGKTKVWSGETVLIKTRDLKGRVSGMRRFTLLAVVKGSVIVTPCRPKCDNKSYTLKRALSLFEKQTRMHGIAEEIAVFPVQDCVIPETEQGVKR